MAASLGLATPDPDHDGWFSRRWPACKAVFNRLSREQQDNLRNLQEKMKTQGVSANLQEKYVIRPLPALLMYISSQISRED